ncbi:sce7726 family protein [uncultured Xanthomonas sp.]|uniref:sce7726 family protein n=1 Tax=uncultured Xanthomonas sp. TaxID=152831 RepID=UPI0025DFF3B9|nr:sce7726 family protein [uncultured Xanthomonas sp.]
MKEKATSDRGALGASIDFECTDPVLVRRLFSSRVLKDLGNSKLPAELSNVLACLERSGQLKTGLTLAALYDAAFKFCFRNQRVEYFYKNALVEKLVLGRRSLSTTAAYLEVRIAEAKLDVLLVGQHMSAYEIKTDFDELARLPAQLKAYQRACRQVSVLTGERYAASVDKLIDPEVGLSILTNRYQLRVLRPAAIFDNALVRSDMLTLLRRSELLHLLQRLGVDVKQIPNTRVFQEAVAASQKMTTIALNAYVAELLLARSSTKRSLIQALPMSLAASSFAQDLTKTQVARLIDLFEMDVNRGLRSELLPVFSR